MRKGISLVALVITIIVLVILTGTVVITTMNNNIFGTAQTTVNEYNKKLIIEDINMKIQTEKINKAQQGIYSMKMIDIIPIIETYGTFDNNILKLRTTQGIEIWLYEIMPIPLEEYATITYKNNILTIQTELINNGYRVQYSTDAGGNWNLYASPTNIAQESGIQIRLINEEGVVLSNVLKITGGVIGEVDNTNPTVTIQPNGIGLAKTSQVTITVLDDNELAVDNVYEYYLSTSKTSQNGGTWTKYTNGIGITIGTNLTGTYYLHIKPVYDVSGNSSGEIVSESYTFDNTVPYTFVPTVSSKTTNSITIQANTSDNNGQTIKYQYSKDNGTTWQDSNTFSGLIAGTTYNEIKVKAEDTVGNVRISDNITVSTVYPTDGTYYANKGVNSPRLASGMTAVYWNGTTEVTSSNPGDDPNFDYNLWYDYKAQTTNTASGGTSKWANAKTSDGSYWVWIPRYGYSITSGYHTNIAGTIEVEFLKDKTNTSTSGRTTWNNASGQGNWNVHPAFHYDGTSTTGTQLSGFWVAKYEMSGETNGTASSPGDVLTSSTIKAVSKPGVTCWSNIKVSNIFTNALNYDATSANNEKLDSHLMKNMEWGAVAYLTQSKYGRNGTEVTINSNSGFYTGGSQGAKANTNVLQSTTGNCYGIYDVSGGRWEYISAYIVGTSTTNSYGATLVNAQSKYKEIYNVGDTEDYGKINGVRAYGDAIYEISQSSYITSGNQAASWYADYSHFLDTSSCFMYRGGEYSNNTYAGIFAFAKHTGAPVNWCSWRVVLW